MCVVDNNEMLHRNCMIFNAYFTISHFSFALYASRLHFIIKAQTRPLHHLLLGQFFRTIFYRLFRLHVIFFFCFFFFNLIYFYSFDCFCKMIASFKYKYKQIYNKNDWVSETHQSVRLQYFYVLHTATDFIENQKKKKRNKMESRRISIEWKKENQLNISFGWAV